MTTSSNAPARLTAADRPDLEPGFWPNYREPSPVSKAIMMPMHPLDRWVNGVLNAHISKAGRARLAQEPNADAV